MITMENYKEEESCKFLLPCGMCEYTKSKCTKWNIVDDIFTVSPAPYQPTPLNTKEWKVGDWPPGPQPTCKDLASNPDTFRVHFEDLPKYNQDTINTFEDLLSSSTTDMYNLSGTLKSR